MAIVNQQITVGTTATAIVDTNDLDGAGKQGPFAGTVVNHDATADMFVGDASVTTTTGAKVAAGGALDVILLEGDVLYGVVASGSLTAGYVGTNYA